MTVFRHEAQNQWGRGRDRSTPCPRTDPCERNYRTRLLPRVNTAIHHRLIPSDDFTCAIAFHQHLFSGPVSGKWEIQQRSPWLPPFSPLPPLDGLCSEASSIIWGYPTSHRRRWQDYGFPSLPRPTMLHRAPMRPPSSCASNFPTCSGSPTAQSYTRTRDSALMRIAFRPL